MYFKEKDLDKFIEYYHQGDGEKQIDFLLLHYDTIDYYIKGHTKIYNYLLGKLLKWNDIDGYKKYQNRLEHLTILKERRNLLDNQMQYLKPRDLELLRAYLDGEIDNKGLAARDVITYQSAKQRMKRIRRKVKIIATTEFAKRPAV